MMLAASILNEVGDDDIRQSIQLPKSFFLGSDLTYIFMRMNGLMHWNDQKYKPEDQIRDECPTDKRFPAGEFPAILLAELP